MWWPRMLAAAVSMVAPLVVPGVSYAASPPDPHDPCAQDGRDSCGTAGVGFYASSRYGVRWYGDYRGAVPGAAHAFCLDLRFWYASPAFRYRRLAAALVNRDGAPVPAERERRLAYAVWRYGRSAKPARQAAVMLYVHALMGDGRPGELDPAAVAVAPLYRRIARDSARYHGPYRVTVQLPRRLVVDRPATAAVRVLSSQGEPLPYVRLTAAVAGADGAPAALRTNAAGVARMSLTPSTTAGLRVQVRTEPLATARVRVFAPTARRARENGQRLAVPAAEAVTRTVTRADVRAVPRLTTLVSAQVVRPGARIHDRIRVAGLGRSPATVEVELFGPFPSRASIRCVHRHLRWHGRITVAGNGETRSPAVVVGRAGFYGYRERLLATSLVAGTTTPCAVEEETTLATPQILTGGADARSHATPTAAGPRTPVRLEIPRLGIAASVSPAAIDVGEGVLGIPRDIHRVGWWRDGSAPGDPRGAILVAGHVDSAGGGAGAFFRLPRARRGTIVWVAARGGRRFPYRVVSVRSYPKTKLPTGVFATGGAARLVLVTCGGPFDAAARHYRDNVVVTAVPMRG